jgi:flagellar biosynthetic protein FlhB
VTGTLAGFQVTFEPLAPDVGRLSPSKGWDRLWSSATTVKALMSLVKAGIILSMLVWVCWQATAEVAQAGTGGLRAALALVWLLTIRMGFAVSSALVLAGLADYAFQRWKFENKLRMSRDELKQERKDDEGDPHMRAKVRKMQREMTKNQMLRDVSSATVVVTNPTHLAVALAYDRATMTAPKVVAKGSDALAKRIVALAKKHEVPVLERKPLAQALFRNVAVGQEIPPHLYHALVEILTYLYQLGKFS